jgi:hypothetical protein
MEAAFSLTDFIIPQRLAAKNALNPLPLLGAEEQEEGEES